MLRIFRRTPCQTCGHGPFAHFHRLKCTFHDGCKKYVK